MKSWFGKAHAAQYSWVQLIISFLALGVAILGKMFNSDVLISTSLIILLVVWVPVFVVSTALIIRNEINLYKVRKLIADGDYDEALAILNKVN